MNNHSIDSLKENMRNMLLEAYKPKQHKDLKCAICGDSNLPLSMHVLEKSFYDGASFQEGFVPMSGSGNRISGSFPVCIKVCHYMQ